MATKKNEPSFEEALALLEGSAQALRSESTTLEDALKHYESGMQYYERCMNLLTEAKQKIELYDRSKEELREFPS